VELKTRILELDNPFGIKEINLIDSGCNCSGIK
jgi:hypothetical protein